MHVLWSNVSLKHCYFYINLILISFLTWDVLLVPQCSTEDVNPEPPGIGLC